MRRAGRRRRELGHERVAEALLNGKYKGRGANIDLRSGGCTPLMLASALGRKGVVRLLLSRGARQELQTSGGWTALHRAVIENHPSIVELLCAAPGAAAALALRDRNGRTALHWAVIYNLPSIVELLCAAPGAAAALALRDSEGRTPLALAVALGHAACEAALRARGAPE